jgi:low temperature requirement protein LtrA
VPPQAPIPTGSAAALPYRHRGLLLLLLLVVVVVGSARSWLVLQDLQSATAAQVLPRAGVARLVVLLLLLLQVLLPLDVQQLVWVAVAVAEAVLHPVLMARSSLDRPGGWQCGGVRL